MYEEDDPNTSRIRGSLRAQSSLLSLSEDDRLQVASEPWFTTWDFISRVYRDLAAVKWAACCRWPFDPLLFLFTRLCTLWGFAQEVGIDLLLRRWNPHIKFRAIIRLKSEQRKVHVRGMFPLREVADVRDCPCITSEKVPFGTQAHWRKKLMSLNDRKEQSVIDKIHAHICSQAHILHPKNQNDDSCFMTTVHVKPFPLDRSAVWRKGSI